MTNLTQTPESTLTFVTNGTGKTGRRVVERLESLGRPVRVGSRAAAIPFDWTQPSTWPAALTGVDSVYLTFVPDLAVPGARDAIGAFTQTAIDAGVRRIVLLSGRGEPEAQQCERIVQDSGLEWTVLRANWFDQNFTEGFLADFIASGHVMLPAGAIAEPFVDVADIADVAVAALTIPGHAGQVYELTGPKALRFDEVVATIAEVTHREVSYERIEQTAFDTMLREVGVPEDSVSLLNYLFTTVLDGRNSTTTDHIERVLGRRAGSFREYVERTHAQGAWSVSARVGVES